MVLCIRLWSEDRLIQGIQDILHPLSVFASYCFDVAIVANVPKMQAVKNLNGFGMLLLHIPDDHVTADQSIESKHLVSPL